MARNNPVLLTGPTRGLDGRSVLAKARSPLITDGRIGDFWIDTVSKKLYGPKNAAEWPDNGLIKGDKGWTPVFATVTDGTRRVQQIVDWTGGEGTKPAVGQYVGADGLVDDIEDAVDFRGPEGPQALINALDAKTDPVTYETLTALGEDGSDNEKAALKRLFEAGANMPFASKGAAAAANIPAAVKTVRTQFYAPNYAIPGTLVGGASYRRVNAEPDVSAAAKFRSVDRWTAEGNSDSANGGWWILDERMPSPFMFGAKGGGSENDTVPAAAAVAYAYSMGLTVDWPDTDFLTTDTIPHLHDVKHTGRGRILRGSDVWYITPTGSQRNIVYYATTGDNANDGLSNASPRLTLSNAATLLNKYGCEGKMIDGRWRLQFAAGTWLNQTLRIGSALKSRYRIELHGVLDEDGTPLTIWEHNNTSILNVVHIEPEGQYEFRGLWAKGVDNTQFASYGFIGKSKVDFWFADCRVTGKSIGFAVINQSEGYMERCWAISCFDGFRGTYSSTISVGLLPEAACRALECTNAGAFVSRTSVAHVDYFNPEDSAYGVLIDMNARAAITGGDFKRCAVGIQTWGGGEWADGGVPVNFNVGTADACTVTFRSQGWGGETRLYSQNSQSYHRIGHGLGPWTTDATSQTTLTNVVAPPAGGRPRLVGGFFADSGKSLRVRAWGTLSGAGISKTLRLLAMDYDTQANPAQLMNLNLGNGEGAFDIDCLIVATSVAAQQHNRRVITPIGTVLIDTATAVSFAADRMLRWYGLLGASGGQISLSGYEVYLVG